MTKEEKIKEVWGKLMPDYTNIDLEDGWSLNDFYEEDFNDVDFHTMQIYTPCKIRPKSLQGIENNNSWYKTEEGLPKVSGVYVCYHKRGYQNQRYFSIEHEEFYEYDSETLKQSDITHYRPVEIIPNPLY